MGRFLSIEFTTLEDLFAEQLHELFDAEHHLADALPKMARGASSPELRSALERQHVQTETHVRRLDIVMRDFAKKGYRVSCNGIKMLIDEGVAVIDSDWDAEEKDVALASAVHRIWHFEMAGYGAARTFAQWLGRNDLADLLEETLAEEAETDETLLHIAERPRNSQLGRM